MSIRKTMITGPPHGALVISIMAFSSRLSTCHDSRTISLFFSKACWRAPSMPGKTCWRTARTSASWLTSVLYSRSSTPDVFSMTCFASCRSLTARANSGGACGMTNFVLTRSASVSNLTPGSVRLTCDRIGPRPAATSSRGLPRTMRSSVASSSAVSPLHMPRTDSWTSLALAWEHMWHCKDKLAKTVMTKANMFCAVSFSSAPMPSNAVPRDGGSCAAWYSCAWGAVGMEVWPFSAIWRRM
mmetsp:Transcript_25751/g.65540  ORF Transcript_25751/g.65540 Transcript_25751/m.65540 type:complete len:242 (-) Transcript_25751:15-740(-)